MTPARDHVEGFLFGLALVVLVFGGALALSLIGAIP